MSDKLRAGLTIGGYLAYHSGNSNKSTIDWSAKNLETSGVVILNNLPITDPLVIGQVWNNAGVLTISAG